MTAVEHVPIARPKYDDLQHELRALRARPSVEVADDLMDTGEDLQGYRARRARIRHLEGLAARRKRPASCAVAEAGKVVTVRYDNSGRTDTFMLGGYGACDADKKIYPLRSPIGRAIVGARAGERRQVLTPDSAPLPVTVIDVRPGPRDSIGRR
ncbi:GreA/GreB family elongation factor [Mycobacterium asiaticum]|uniref:Transcription elongation factor GreA/GreB C-terminal domain-containing protein n=1 Tax=Mycobacterium asiaticum TaxID=1790 RepID=A0A1A3MPT2_MYCAS|nr:GreA/GreB family elongation factor [Mycobacterium asiaticum]OBK11075.1 hypothetical protein A5636_14265 [Mycobacterium asiaticum]